jgi:hypothetical protein
MKVIKDNLTDIVDWLLNPKEAIPQSKLDEITRYPSSHPESIQINDDGEIVELVDGKPVPDNFITGKIENPKCFVVPDKFGNVRFMFVSKKFRVKKTNVEGYRLNK